MPSRSAATCLPSSSLRSTRTHRAPVLVRARAEAAPMPEAPPVTMADAPLSSMDRSFVRGSNSAAADQRAGPQTAAAAHRDEGVLSVASLELVDGLGDEDGARPAQGVAEGDGAAVGVDPVHVGAGLPGPAEHDGGERLVDLDDVDVADGQLVM